MRSVHNVADRTPAQDALLRAVTDAMRRSVGRIIGEAIGDTWAERAEIAEGRWAETALEKALDKASGLVEELDAGNAARGAPEFRRVLDELDRVVAEATAAAEKARGETIQATIRPSVVRPVFTVETEANAEFDAAADFDAYLRPMG